MGSFPFSQQALIDYMNIWNVLHLKYSLHVTPLSQRLMYWCLHVTPPPKDLCAGVWSLQWWWKHDSQWKVARSLVVPVLERVNVIFLVSMLILLKLSYIGYFVHCHVKTPVKNTLVHGFKWDNPSRQGRCNSSWKWKYMAKAPLASGKSWNMETWTESEARL